MNVEIHLCRDLSRGGSPLHELFVTLHQVTKTIFPDLLFVELLILSTTERTQIVFCRVSLFDG